VSSSTYVFRNYFTKGRRCIDLSTSVQDSDVETAELAIIIRRDVRERSPVRLDADPEGWGDWDVDFPVNETYGEFVFSLHPKTVDHVGVLGPFNCGAYGRHSLILHKREPDEHSGYYDVGRIWFDSGALFAFNRYKCDRQEPTLSGDWYGGTGTSCLDLNTFYFELFTFV
jgi:hypothetical protein